MGTGCYDMIVVVEIVAKGNNEKLGAIVDRPMANMLQRCYTDVVHFLELIMKKKNCDVRQNL